MKPGFDKNTLSPSPHPRVLILQQKIKTKNKETTTENQHLVYSVNIYCVNIYCVNAADTVAELRVCYDVVLHSATTHI